jgi:hypothetical protein
MSTGAVRISTPWRRAVSMRWSAFLDRLGHRLLGEQVLAGRQDLQRRLVMRVDGGQVQDGV